MKKPLIFFVTVFALGAGAAVYARDSVSLSINAGEPTYYRTPPAYYRVNDEPYWWNTPVKVVYFEGRPHRMHYWNGRWYDEAWSRNRYDNRRHDNRRYHRSYERGGWHDRDYRRGWHY